MALKKFTFESLSKIDDGRIAVAVDQALRRAQDDCADRPGVGGARKVVLTISLVPAILDADVRLESVDLQCDIKESAPKREGRKYNMGVNARGDLLFNELSPDDHRQMTLDEGGGGPRRLDTGEEAELDRKSRAAGEE